MKLADFLKTNAEKMGLLDAGGVIDQLVSKAGEMGFDLLASNAKDEDYVPKARLSDVVTSKNNYKGQVAELTKQIEELKKAAQGNEALTKQIEDLQKQNADAQAKYQAQLLETKIEAVLSSAKAKNPKLAAAALDKAKLELAEDGTVKGLEEQLKTLQTSDPYLFGEPEQVGGGTNTPPSFDGKNPFKMGGPDFSLTKQAELWEKDPATAQKLAQEAGYTI